MEVNLGIWSVVIGLMELGCAMTWNHEEQFVEGDFPYYPYNNRIYAYTGDTDGLTDARMRSNEFSGFKTALNRRNFQEKRKSLYAFNKDSNKLIDATKLEDSDEPENIESSQSRKLNSSKLERLKPAEATHSDSDGSEEHELKSAKSEKLVRARPEMLNSADPEKLDLPSGSEKPKVDTTVLSRNHEKGAEMKNDKSRVSSLIVPKKKEFSREKSASSRSKTNSSKLEILNSAEASPSDLDGSEELNSAEHKPNSTKSKKLLAAEPENPNSPEARNSESDESGKLPEHELNSAKSEKIAPEKSEKLHSADSEKSDLLSGWEQAKLETGMLSRNRKKGGEIKNDKSNVPSLILFNDRRFRRNSGLDANFARSRPIGESDSREVWAHGMARATPSAGSPKRKFAREYKPEDKSRKLTLVAPYENNFTGGGLHSVNPSSWLAKEIERFIRRKDHRWLDFMKNTGMDVKKYSGVVSDAKQKSVKTNTKKTSCINCLKPSSAPTRPDDPAKLKTDLLINRIDSLLADLNQFRSSVKNGWSDINSIKKAPESETSQKLTNDDIMDRRKHRLRRGIRISRISAPTRRPARPATASDLVENDLRDLRKNVVLYQNRIPDEEMQALEDMKLHIKVYVDKGKNHEREDHLIHHTSGSEMDYYESYPQQIHYLK